VKQPVITKDNKVQCDINWQPVTKDNKVQCDIKWQPAIKDNKVKFDKKVQFLETVDENKKFYTKRQFQRAKRACKLLYSLGYPSINDMKAIIWKNAIKNNPVTTEDINIAEKIFGPDVATLKGKTTHHAPVPAIEDCSYQNSKRVDYHPIFCHPSYALMV
jgi:hypothetical protein